MKATSSPGRTRLLGIALLAVTFIAGAMSGAAFDRFLTAEPATDRSGETAAADRRDRSRHCGDSDLFGHLDLNPDQRERIDQILAHRKEQMDAFWGREGSRLRATIDSTRAEIRAVLTPAQQEAYDRLRAERREREREKRRRDCDRKETGTP